MRLNSNFLGEREDVKQKPSVGGVWIFSGTAHYAFLVRDGPRNLGFSTAVPTKQRHCIFERYKLIQEKEILATAIGIQQETAKSLR